MHVGRLSPFRNIAPTRICSLRDRRTNGKPTKQGFEYTRSDNPNRNLLETLLASLEAGGSTALALASGSAATGLFVAALGANAHVVSVNDVYGGTARYLRNVASVTQNLSTTFVDLERATDEEILNSFKENTRAVWIETPTNPTLRLIDIPRIVRLAKQAPSRPLVLVDNTFMSPFYQSPLLLGADVVLHSITKYINGHSDVLMGAIILPPAETIAGKGGFGTAAAPGSTLEVRLRYLQNAMGGVPGAYDSWLAQRGAKTLALRMKAHGANALRLARWLSTQGVQLGLVKPGQDGVVYPGLPSTASGGRKGFELVRDVLISPHARKWIDSGAGEGAPRPRDNGEKLGAEEEGIPFGGMVSFRIADPVVRPSQDSTTSLSSPTTIKRHSTAERFLTSTQLFTLAESLGGIESLAELPSLMTHGSLPPEAREALGISDDLIRLSVGVEEWEDIQWDVESALRWAVRGEKWDANIGKWVVV